MQWSYSEIKKLSSILEQMQTDLEPLDGKSILVLCSAAGRIPFWLAERMTRGHILALKSTRTAWQPLGGQQQRDN